MTNSGETGQSPFKLEVDRRQRDQVTILYIIGNLITMAATAEFTVEAANENPDAPINPLDLQELTGAAEGARAQIRETVDSAIANKIAELKAAQQFTPGKASD